VEVGVARPKIHRSSLLDDRNGILVHAPSAGVLALLRFRPLHRLVLFVCNTPYPLPEDWKHDTPPIGCRNQHCRQMIESGAHVVECQAAGGRGGARPHEWGYSAQRRQLGAVGNSSDPVRQCSGRNAKSRGKQRRWCSGVARRGRGPTAEGQVRHLDQLRRSSGAEDAHSAGFAIAG
jgi:hypothetical protein